MRLTRVRLEDSLLSWETVLRYVYYKVYYKMYYEKEENANKKCGNSKKVGQKAPFGVLMADLCHIGTILSLVYYSLYYDFLIYLRV